MNAVADESHRDQPVSLLPVFLIRYAAGYYSYKWAEVLSSDAYAAFEEEGVLNPAPAARFRREILEIGGTRDIGVAFRAFRGRPPDIAALLRHSGITAAAAGETATAPA